MSEIRIYHNPSCSKSRETLALLKEQGIDPVITEYLAHTPSSAELRDILQKLGISARELLRTGEDEYRSLNLANSELSEDALLAAMVAHPRLIERPIVIHGNQARLGRPPQKVLEIL
ncbi:MAG: hypothetical protein RL217_1012 [Pseudomonadota bacterium]